MRLLVMLGIMGAAQMFAQGNVSSMPSAKAFALMHETMAGAGVELLAPETRELIAESWHSEVPAEGSEGALATLLRSFRSPIPGVSLSSLSFVSKKVRFDTVRGFILVVRFPNLRKSKLSLTHR